MGAPQKYTAQEVIDAIVEEKGVLSQAGKRLGCTRQTVTNYIDRYPTVKAAFDEANETNVDYVESRLMANIEKGDTTAIIFFLKTKGKHRGYVERQEITGQDGGKLEVEISADDLLNSRLDAIAERLRRAESLMSDEG